MTISIKDLYPDATERQLEKAERRLESYLRVMSNIARRMLHEELDGARDEAQDDGGRNYQQ